MSLRSTLAVPVALVSLLGGVVVGAAATFVHGVVVGMVLALVATLASVVALPPGWARLPFAVGWLATVFYFSNPRPEGDYLVASNTDGYLLLGSGMAIVAFGIVTLRPRAPRRDAPSTPARPADVGDVGTVADPS